VDDRGPRAGVGNCEVDSALCLDAPADAGAVGNQRRHRREEQRQVHQCAFDSLGVVLAVRGDRRVGLRRGGQPVGELVKLAIVQQCSHFGEAVARRQLTVVRGERLVQLAQRRARDGRTIRFVRSRSTTG